VDKMIDNRNRRTDTEASEEFYVTDDSPALLCTVNNHMEVTFIESLMRSANIPVMKKWRNAGDAAMIYMAVSFTGADLYVPSKLLDKAKELLAAEPVEPDAVSETDDNFVELLEQHTEKRRERARVMLFLIFVVPVVFALLIGLLAVVGAFG